MRNELEQIKKIEAYLTGQLTGAERADFEKEAAANADLQQQLKLQQQIMSGIERTAIKQDVQRAAIRFKRMRRFYKGGLGGLFILAIIASVLYYVSPKMAYTGKVLPTVNELGKTDWASADSSIAPQTFLINTAKDTVVETRSGIILSIPANCFLTDDGLAVNGDIEFVVKEALDAASIVKAGLSTKAGNELLETGGMFFIDARKDGKPLKIDPNNNIYGQIPTDSVKSSMLLFKGKRMPNGTIDWVEPKPTSHDLTPVDIKTLNFYPPGYLDSLAKWGYNSHDKKFTDSLYYSFASIFAPQQDIFSEMDKRFIMQNADSITASDEPIKPGTETFIPFSDHPVCGINPAKIKAIWNEKFDNTLLATREFEQRLYWIHKDGSDKLLDLYTNNLNRPMYVTDSIIASAGDHIYRDKFLAFFKERAGSVNISAKQAKRLKEYFALKTKAYTLAAAKTQNALWNKQRELDNIAASKQSQHLNDEDERNSQNFTEEFDVNLKEAYRQLGYKPTNSRPPSKASYNVIISSTGWCNVDRYVYESVTNRTTLDFVDGTTGKTAHIKYAPVSFQIDQSDRFDKLLVYLLPDKLSSFMPVNGANGLYSEKLDEQMKYSLVCVAYRDEQAFVYRLDNVEAKAYVHITLSAVIEKELTRILTKTASRAQAAKLQKENVYQRFDIQDKKRQKANMLSQELSSRIRMYFFTCYFPATSTLPSMPVKKI